MKLKNFFALSWAESLCVAIIISCLIPLRFKNEFRGGQLRPCVVSTPFFSFITIFISINWPSFELINLIIIFSVSLLLLFSDCWHREKSDAQLMERSKKRNKNLKAFWELSSLLKSSEKLLAEKTNSLPSFCWFFDQLRLILSSLTFRTFFEISMKSPNRVDSNKDLNFYLTFGL